MSFLDKLNPVNWVKSIKETLIDKAISNALIVVFEKTPIINWFNGFKTETAQIVQVVLALKMVLEFLLKGFGLNVDLSSVNQEVIAIGVARGLEIIFAAHTKYKASRNVDRETLEPLPEVQGEKVEAVDGETITIKTETDILNKTLEGASNDK